MSEFAGEYNVCAHCSALWSLCLERRRGRVVRCSPWPTLSWYFFLWIESLESGKKENGDRTRILILRKVTCDEFSSNASNGVTCLIADR